MRWNGFAAKAVVVAVILAVIGYPAWVKLRPPYVVAVGTPIRHDDFFFTVKRVTVQRLSDGFTLYHVTINVNNAAKIVNYHWRDDIAYVRAFDDRGFGHDFFSETRGSFTLAAGDARDAELAFRLPNGASSPGVYFWDGIYMGDALNGVAYAKAVVPLADYHPPFGT
ncbi:MAG TPA: hypothetical protein VKT72_10105 [Candidatus Baltobacteraceae bacterium]|nr:hypothetical protein [Candidatus Baltobacteraceae bacterium]